MGRARSLTTNLPLTHYLHNIIKMAFVSESYNYISLQYQILQLDVFAASIDHFLGCFLFHLHSVPSIPSPLFPSAQDVGTMRVKNPKHCMKGMYVVEADRREKRSIENILQLPFSLMHFSFRFLKVNGSSQTTAMVQNA